MKPGFALLLCGLAVIWVLAGCTTPGSRAHHHAAAFQKLSADDQRLALQGRVHRGMTAEAVYIAWGEPDEKKTADRGKDAAETWIYERQLVITAPFGSFDQWVPGSSVFHRRMWPAIPPGAAFGGIGNEGMLLYQPHLRTVDATVKRAEFIDGKLDRYDIRQGRFAVAP